MKKQKTHGNIQNIWYYLKIWGRTFPWGLFFILFSVPMGILAIYEQIRIPQLLIGGLESNLPGNVIFTRMAWAFLWMTGAKLFMELSETKLMTRGSRPLMWLYSVPIHKKLFKMKYQQLISSSVQNKLAKVENIVLRGGGGDQIHFFGVKFSNLLIALVGSAVFASDIFRVDGILLLVIFLSVFFNLGYGVYAGKCSAQNMRERSEWEKKELYFVKISENRAYAKDIRLYKWLEPIKRAFQFYHKKHASYLKKEARVLFGGGALNALSLFFRDILAYTYLMHQLIHGILKISDFVFLAALIMQFSAWMEAIVFNFNELILFSAQMEQLRDFIELEEQDPFQGQGCAAKVCDCPEIEFSHLTYGYPESEEYIFEDFNLKIKSGEKLALVGINGAGKTTLMHLLMGLLEPVKGKILIDGKDSKEFKQEEYYQLFSPVFQDVIIFPETVAVNIAGEKEYDPERMKQAIRGAGMEDFIQTLEQGEKTPLVQESDEEAIDLSGGMNQRLLLARALYKDAKINILDEPTAALDPLAESRIYEEYARMSLNKTSVFISHRLASTRFCDRIILLENGKIEEEGSHEALMALQGKYYQMYRVQSKYYQEGGEYED